MSRVFISGSTTSLGLMVGELLISQGHQVVLHARNIDRAEEARRAFPKAEATLQVRSKLRPRSIRSAGSML